jgi:crotonobetainyl-CoA:carnitine CoA-transferase CaiB-like acyl-CoA transferase
VRVTATPVHVDGRPLSPGGAAPYRVGEHTRTVLTEVLGYSPGRLEELRKLGAVETV